MRGIKYTQKKLVRGKKCKLGQFNQEFKNYLRRYFLNFFRSRHLIYYIFNLKFLKGKRLRQLVDERYTACSLLGLSRNEVTSIETAVLPSSSICKDFLSDIKSDKNFQILDQNVLALENTTASPSNKRIRRSGKYSPQERELIR